MVCVSARSCCFQFTHLLLSMIVMEKNEGSNLVVGRRWLGIIWFQKGLNKRVDSIEPWSEEVGGCHRGAIFLTMVWQRGYYPSGYFINLCRFKFSTYWFQIAFTLTGSASINRHFEEEIYWYINCQQTSMQSNGGETEAHFPIHIEGNDSEQYEPFGIEKKPGRSINGDDRESFHSDNLNSLQLDANNPLSTANVLKTLFFVLVWYIFSLLLTL